MFHDLKAEINSQIKSELGSPDIILQKDLSLDGSIEDIFFRMYKNDYSLILKIIADKYKRRKQSGKPTIFSRRKPKESELKDLNHSKKYLYNFIRMLEDPYPNAYIKCADGRKLFITNSHL